VDEPANPKAHVVLYKRAPVEKEQPASGAVHIDRPDWLVSEKAVMDAGTRSNLPDSAFAAVWTDADGKKQRKLPYRHADGSIDLPHLRNALSRISQTDMPSSVRGTARRKLDAAKEQHMKKTFLSKLREFITGVEKEAGPLSEWAEQEESEPEHATGMTEKLAAYCAKLGEAISGYGDGEFPPEHPVHSLKALFKEMGDTVSACNKAAETAKAAAVAKAAADNIEISKREVELEKKLVETEKALAVERDAAALAKVSTELRKFSHVSVNPDADAPIFKKLADTDKPAYDRVIELLSGANAAVEKGGLTKEIGSSQPGDGKVADVAWAAIEAEAATMVAADPKVTKAKAIDIVMKKRPDLVKQHLASTAPVGGEAPQQ
jgi:hypothetical protein